MGIHRGNISNHSGVAITSFLLPSSARFHFRCAACAIAAAAAQPNTVISLSYSYAAAAAAVSKRELRSCPADTV